MKLKLNKIHTSTLILYYCTRILIVSAQYNYGISSHNQAKGYYPSSGEESEQQDDDDRPKVQLGFRLRVPAIRFELPRVSLPKITISAKIRQPDGPRTINLPEINLDTSSRLSPGGAVAGLHVDNGGGKEGPLGGGKVNQYHQQRMKPYFKASTGGYSVSASEYSSPAVHHHQQQQQQQHYGAARGSQESTFTFSASEENSDNGSGKSASFNHQAHHQQSPYVNYPAANNFTPHLPSATSYSSSQPKNILNSAYSPSYYSNPVATSKHNDNFVQQKQVTTTSDDHSLHPTKTSEVGFSSPVYLEQAHDQLFYVNGNRLDYQQQQPKLMSPMMNHGRLTYNTYNKKQAHHLKRAARSM